MTPRRGSKPEFSVVMANFNNAPYVGHAIQSVIGQTFQDWELVLADDHSSDDSLAAIEPFLHDERIRFLRNERNIGYVGTLKRLIGAAQSEFIGVLDSDDALVPNALEAMHAAHMAHPDAGLVYSQFMYCDRELTPIKPGFSAPREPGKTILHTDCASAFRTFKKSFYAKTEGLDERILHAEDKDLNYKLEEVSDVVYVDEILYLHRRLENSQSNDEIKAQIGLVSHDIARYHAYVRRRRVDVPNLGRRAVSLHLHRSGLLAMAIGDTARARFCILRAIWVYPFAFKPYVRWVRATTKRWLGKAKRPEQSARRYTGKGHNRTDRYSS